MAEQNNFYGLSMMKLLLAAQKNVTLMDPLIMNGVSIVSIDRQKSANEKEKITEEAFQKFSDKVNRYGTVHCDRAFWSSIFFQKLENANNKDKKIYLPNGCCTMEDCPVKLYYELLGSTCPVVSECLVPINQ